MIYLEEAELLEFIKQQPISRPKDEGRRDNNRASEVFEKYAGTIKEVLLRCGIRSKEINIHHLAKELCEAGVMAHAELYQVEHLIKCDSIKVSAIVSACSTTIKRGKRPDIQLRKFITVIEKYDGMKVAARKIMTGED